jgi:hypothetical protein
MTTVAIMQPTYLPWCGYFAMIDQADVFVLLDTVAIDKKSWQTRNRIRTRDGHVVWLSVPTHAHQGQPLNEVEIVDNGWQAKHWRTIEQAYSHTPGWPDVGDAIEWAYRSTARTLTGLTSNIIVDIAATVGITTPIVKASSLAPSRTDKIGRIEDLCHAVHADVLLDTRGATFLESVILEDVQTESFDYDHPTYPQGKQEWQSHLSIIDLIAHCGTNSLTTIRIGFYDSTREPTAQQARPTHE